MNKPNLEVFIGSGFDMEFTRNQNFTCSMPHLGYLSTCQANNFSATNTFYELTKCRPRLNKPQVLDDYSFIESLEEFVFDMELFTNNNSIIAAPLEVGDGNYLLWNKIESGKWRIIWLSFKGVAKGSIYEEWAIENDVPIIEV